MNISQAFADFPTEATLIGRILAGYTDLEVDLMHCVRASWNLDTVFKVMYRGRGETQRIEIADSFGRKAHRALNLGTQFEMGLGAVRHCLKIRNQYAHCIWWNDNSGSLAFANLEDLAKVNDEVADLRGANVRHVTVAQLESQFAYFEYASNLLIWVLHEGNKAAGRPAMPNLQQPAQMVQPAIFFP